MTSEYKNPKRLLYAEALRIIAAFSVVFQHTASSAWYSLSPSSDSWFCLNFFNGIARFGVGIFVMISGAFLLTPSTKRTPQNILKKNLVHLLKLIIFWGIFYGIFQTFFQHGTLKDYLLSPLLIFTKPQTHLWFLYMLAGLYLFTPALIIFTKNASEKMLRFTLFSLAIFGMVIPSISHLTERLLNIEIYKHLAIQGTTSFLVYYLAGFYFSKFTIQKRTRILLYISSLFSLGISIFGSTYLSLLRNVPDEYFFGNFRPTNLIIVLAIFVFFKAHFQDKVVENKFVTTLAVATLGIYIIHPVFLKLFYSLKFSLISPTPWLNVPIAALFIFLLSFLCTFLLRKIPFLKNFL